MNNTIEFKVFEFTGFEDFKNKRNNYNNSMQSYQETRGIINIQYIIDSIVDNIPNSQIYGIEAYVYLEDFEECILSKRFEYSEQGYTDACKWLNRKKYNLAKQLAE